VATASLAGAAGLRQPVRHCLCVRQLANQLITETKAGEGAGDHTYSRMDSDKQDRGFLNGCNSLYQVILMTTEFESPFPWSAQ
jgi:hypothetical protein